MAHPETDGQTERVNRVLEDILRSYATFSTRCSAFLSFAEFVLSNYVHASIKLAPLFENSTRQPRAPALLAVVRPTASCGSPLGEEEGDKIDQMQLTVF